MKLLCLNCANIIGVDFPGDTSGKESASNAGDIRDTGSIPGLGR